MTFEEKMEIVINNYFKKECSVNTSIREAFEKGFRIGVKKGQSAQPTIIRCKDCAYWQREWSTEKDCHYCTMVDDCTDREFYCANAEQI